METQSRSHQARNNPHFVETVQESVENPKVNEAMKALSKYGLGVSLVHTRSKTGELVPLPNGWLQIEAYLQVSFERLNIPNYDMFLPVGWIRKEDVHGFICVNGLLVASTH